MSITKDKAHSFGGGIVRVVARAHKVTISITPILNVTSGLYADAKIDVSTDPDKFLMMVQECAELAWPGIQPKVADSAASDYDSYYDSKRDVEYELSGLRKIIRLCGYPGLADASYDFNKRRMQSYLFDLLEAKERKSTNG